MSILIKGMEMPESCDKCSLFNECWCTALGIENWRKSYNKPGQGERLPDCPLVPLPEGHGRLGDLTEIEKKLQKTLDGMGDRWLSSTSMMAQGLRLLPT